MATSCYPDFREFPKMPRYSRECIVTEKIDGTNAQVYVTDHGDILAGSRNRWITVADDNFGFAKWVEGNRDELLKLGPGRHFGEWWGQGIQRNYGLKEKRFSLFNVARWADPSGRPECCDAVPIIGRGCFDDSEFISGVISHLRIYGSVAAPGFMKPEGIIIFHIAGNIGFKKTLEKDELPKSMAA